jgi:hypothetical protein
VEKLVLDYDGLGWACADARHAQDAVIHASWARLLRSAYFDHIVNIHGTDLNADASALTEIEINYDIRQIQFHLLLYYPLFIMFKCFRTLQITENYG